jgi:hypothetical protein
MSLPARLTPRFVLPPLNSTLGVASLAAAFLASGVVADAQVSDRRWIGIAGGDWAVPGNWSGGDVPDSPTERAEFLGTGLTNAVNIGTGNITLLGLDREWWLRCRWEGHSAETAKPISITLAGGPRKARSRAGWAAICRSMTFR